MSQPTTYVQNGENEQTFVLTVSGLKSYVPLGAAGAAVQYLADSARTHAVATGSVGYWFTETMFGARVTVGWFRNGDHMNAAVQQLAPNAAA